MKAKTNRKQSNNAWSLKLYATAHQCLAAESVEPLRQVFAEREAWARVHSKAKDKGKAYREAFARYDRGERPSVFAEDGNGSCEGCYREINVLCFICQ
jgi:hypothetical protein